MIVFRFLLEHSCGLVFIFYSQFRNTITAISSIKNQILLLSWESRRNDSTKLFYKRYQSCVSVSFYSTWTGYAVVSNFPLWSTQFHYEYQTMRLDPNCFSQHVADKEATISDTNWCLANYNYNGLKSRLRMKRTKKVGLLFCIKIHKRVEFGKWTIAQGVWHDTAPLWLV